MAIEDFCRPDPVTARPDESVRDAARRMASDGVGCLAIVDDEGKPVGMVTDRDLVQRVIRRRRDPDEVKLSEILSPDVVSVWREVPLELAFHRMREEAVRRVLITDDHGLLVGILTFDDALPLISKQYELAAQVMSAQHPATPGQ